MRKANFQDKVGIKKFGNKVRELRLKRGLSQEQLAYDTDLHLSQIGRIERGEINTSISFVFLFAKVLKVKPSEFFEYED